MSQFMVVPPLAKIAPLFSKLTGCTLHIDACWSTWAMHTVEDFEWLRPYIRPCHQKILNETISREQPTPLALLRQLLRPHGMRIEQRNGQYIVVISSPMGGGICEKEGVVIDWAL